MKASESLFHLIKSLSFAEKRHFSKFAQRHKKAANHLSLQLFTSIDAQKSYDEAALKEHFQGTTFGKSLAFPKSHLYDQILRSLQTQGYEKSISGRFRSDLNKIELLAKRGLPDQAHRLLEKSLKRAISFEAVQQILSLYRWKRRLVLRMQDRAIREEMKEITAAEKQWETAFNYEQAALRLHDEVYVTLQEARRKTQTAERTPLAEFGNRIAALEKKSGLTFEAKVALSRAGAHYYHLQDDFGSVHAAFQREVAIWDAHPQHIQADPLRYVRTVGAWLNRKAIIRDNENLFVEIERLRKHTNLSKPGKAKVFELTTALELFYYLNATQFQQAMDLVSQIESGLKQYNDLLAPAVKLAFYHNLSIVFWLGKRPSDALRWVNRILQFEDGSIRADIRQFAPVLEKIVQFELEHEQALESWFRSLAYRKRKPGKVPQLEQLLADLIRNVRDEQDKRTRQAEFRTFLTGLAAYKNNSGVSRLGLAEIEQWATAYAKS